MEVSTTHRINLSIWILIYSFSDTYYVWAVCGFIKFTPGNLYYTSLVPKLSRIKVKKAISSCVFRTFSSVSMLTNLTALLLHSSRQQQRCGSHLGWKRVQKVVESTNPECSSPCDHWDGENRRVYHINYIKANFLAISCSLLSRQNWSLLNKDTAIAYMTLKLEETDRWKRETMKVPADSYYNTTGKSTG